MSALIIAKRGQRPKFAEKISRRQRKIFARKEYYEKNLSTQEKTEKQGSRFQKAHGFDRRQKGFEEKKKQGQKEAQRLKKRN